MEWLNFIATELHKQFGPLWYPTTPDATKEAQKAKLATRFEYLVDRSSARSRISPGPSFTIADAYLFTILNWAPMLKVGPDAVPRARRSTRRASPRARPCIARWSPKVS